MERAPQALITFLLGLTLLVIRNNKTFIEPILIVLTIKNARKQP